MKKYAVNLILLAAGVVGILCGCSIDALAGLSFLGVIALILAYALGTSTKGRYNLFTPARSIIVTVGCFLSVILLGYCMYICFRMLPDATGETLYILSVGADAGIWMAMLIDGIVIVLVIAELLVRLGYRIFKGQKFTFQSILERGKKWMIVDGIAVLLVIVAWIAVNQLDLVDIIESYEAYIPSEWSEAFFGDI